MANMANMKGSKETPIVIYDLDSDEDGWTSRKEPSVHYELNSDDEFTQVTHPARSGTGGIGRPQQQQSSVSTQTPLSRTSPSFKDTVVSNSKTTVISLQEGENPAPPTTLKQTAIATEKSGASRIVRNDPEHHTEMAPRQVPQNGFATLLCMSAHRSMLAKNIEVPKYPQPPIGARADPLRDQTSFSRVDTASPIPRRVTDEEATRSVPVRKPTDRVRKSIGPNVAKKSAQSDPRRSKSTLNSTKQAARSTKADSRPEIVGQTRNGGGHQNPVRFPEAPGLSRVGVDSEAKDSSFDPKTPLAVCSATAVCNSANTEQNVMGAHVSSTMVSNEKYPPPALNARLMSETGAGSLAGDCSNSSNSHDAKLAVGQRKEATEHLDDRESRSNTSRIDTMDVVKARLAVETSLKRHLEDRYEDHAYLARNAMWRQRTCIERDVRAQHGNATGLPKKYIQSKSPFEDMASIEVAHEKRPKDRMRDISQEVFSRVNSKDTVIKYTWSVPVTTHRTQAALIPPFKEYVSLRMNVLADNESKLTTMPYLGEEDEEGAQKALMIALPQIYEIRHDKNALLDLRNEQCRFYNDTIESFMTDIGISWETVLFWLLASDLSVQQINRSSAGYSGFESAILNRSVYNEEKFRRDEGMRTAVLFERDAKHWTSLLHRIREPGATELRLTALACATILSECGFSAWYMARKSRVMQEHVQKKVQSEELVSSMASKIIACRVCHQHNCPFHGELRENPDSDLASDSEDEQDTNDDIDVLDNSISGHKNLVYEESSSEAEGIIPAHIDEDDSDIEKVINYRIPMNPDALPAKKYPESTKRLRPPNGPFNAKWWLQHTRTKEWETRRPFVPCSHEGSCVDAKCRCYRDCVTCEKTCSCPSSCNRRFPGCDCTSTLDQEKRVCGNDKQCLCAKFNRECDADVCGGCGATEILDPVSRYNEDITRGRCSNVGIQRGVPKKTLLGQSEVHGFGLYAGQDIKKDDIIGEYTGEIISCEESARRAIIYEYDKNMYLFKLNKRQEVDATYMGNKLRFINNANKNLTNCSPKVLLCNTVFRVALYATVDIKAGTELFFHYNYPAEVTKNFKQPKSNLVAVKQITKAITVKTKGKTKPLDVDYDGRRHEALAKARAVKAAKRLALLAEQGDTPRSNLYQARKSAPNKATQQITSNPAAVVQETDEDDDFLPGSQDKATSDVWDWDSEVNSEGDVSARRLNKPSLIVKLPTAFAAKDKMGGRKLGESNKRKRATGKNSDED